MKKTREQFISEAKKLNPDYDYSNVVYDGNKTKVLIVCDKGHRFLQTPNHHLRGQKCPVCTNHIKLTRDVFIKRARERHGDKYDYSLVGELSSHNDKLTIICPVHGKFKQTAYGHIHYGCRKCGRDTLRKSSSDFVEKVKSIYGDEYDYSLVNYRGRETPVKLICKKHGVFERIPRNLLRKKCGCPKCYHESQRITQEEFVRRAKEINGTRYDYGKVEYVNMVTPVTIICDKGHEFRQKPQEHLFMFSGCPICSSEKHSKGERLVRTYLKNHGIGFVEQKTFDGCVFKASLLFDFYIPSENTCIEYQGMQHYVSCTDFGGDEDFEKRKERDRIKREYCRSHGIRLIEIKYNENAIKKLDNCLYGRSN